MAHLEIGGSRFWKCDVVNKTDVVTTYGKIGKIGRTVTKSFATQDEASTYITKQIATKRKAGYSDLIPAVAAVASSSSVVGEEDVAESGDTTGDVNTPNATLNTKTASTKRKISTVSAIVSPSPKKGPPSINIDSDIDPCVADVIDATLASQLKIHKAFHARLVSVEPNKNSDHYFILQVLIAEKHEHSNKKIKRVLDFSGKGSDVSSAGIAPADSNEDTASTQEDHYLFTRWGVTGTSGTSSFEGPMDKEEAKDAFEKSFQSKTGVEFSTAVLGNPPLPGKYEYVADSLSSKMQSPSLSATDYTAGTWYYYLADDPMGKADGWYMYDSSNSYELEELYRDYVTAKKSDRLSKRVVHSTSVGFNYNVNLKTLRQINTSSGTSRPIERTANGSPPLQVPETDVVTKVALKTTPTVVPGRMSSISNSNNVAVGMVDSSASSYLQSGGKVVHDIMLNQTNLANNNNKFYKLQLVQTTGNSYVLFTKWGRVGERGKTQEQEFSSLEAGTRAFAKKFRSKTANTWESYHRDKSSFVSKSGKYTVLEMEADEEAAEAMKIAAMTATEEEAYVPTRTPTIAPSKLDPKTKRLVDLIFDKEMFHSTMTAMNIDPRKLPLGALSQAQINKGYKVLETLQNELATGTVSNHRCMELTSSFYTLIPHSFGRSRPPTLTTENAVKEKFDMLNVLSDIETAQAMQKKNREEASKKVDVVLQPHPSDLNYQQLASNITLLDPSNEADQLEYGLIRKYFDDTSLPSGGNNMSFHEVWRVDRHNEFHRYAKHDGISNRYLLWHGTNVAVVAAILKSGLRIMPHSGGRVGRGIYLADQHQKSAWYTRSSKGTTIMFLVEAAVGKPHGIYQDDSSLRSPPAGYDSVLAKGRTEPPDTTELTIDGKTVLVPQGKPTRNQDPKAADSSSFDHNEFLIYQESLHRIRYILTFKGGQ